MTPTLEDLRAEYETNRIGPLILGEVERAVRGIVPRYDPMIYAGSASWDDAEEDVVQGVVTDLLLGEGQLDYIMATALTLDDVRNLLRFQVRRYLARNRRRTVVDNLLDRAKEVLRAPPYVEVALGRFGLPGRADPRPPTEAELRAAARAAALVPRLPPSGGERAPSVYSAEAFAVLMQAVVAALPMGVSLSELGKILEHILTDWLASLLYDLEEGWDQVAEPLDPQEQALSRRAAEEVIERCPPEQLLILRRKLEGVSDEEIARELGVSRPTVHARKRAAFGTLKDILGGLSVRAQEDAMARLSLQLAALRAPGPGGTRA